MPETTVFHQLELMYNLKQDVDYIVRQLNQQNRLISRMRRFQKYCKDFLEGTNQIGLKRLDLEYTKFDRDYRHLNRVCQKMNRKLYASLIYDKISNLFVSLTEDCAEIYGGGGGQLADIKVDVDEDNEIENDNYSGYIYANQLNELDSGEFYEFAEESFDVSVEERKESNSVIVDDRSTSNNITKHGLENVVDSKANKSGKMVKCDIEDCQFVTKGHSNLTRHKLNVHKISNQRQLSDPLCHFTTRQLSNLTRQGSSTSKSEDSSTAVKKTSTQSQPKQTSKQQALYRCDLSADCTYVTNCSKNLKHHQWIHSAKQLYCDYDGCDFHTVKPGTLEFHRKRIHNRYHSGHTSGQLSNLTRQKATPKSKNSLTPAMKTSTQTQPKQTPKQEIFRCDFGSGCTFAANYLHHLKRHQWIHLGQEFKCDYDGCNYLTIQPRNFMEHQNKSHHRFPCGYRECRFVGKRDSDLRVHRANGHKHSEKEYRCSVGGCEFISRKRYDLLHYQTAHVGETSKKSITSLPSTSKSPRPLTSKSPRPLTSKSPLPLTSKFPRPLTSKSPLPLTSKSPRPSNVFQCSYPGCDYSANRQYKLFEHQITHNAYKCSHRHCSYTGKRLADLKGHQTKMHNSGGYGG